MNLVANAARAIRAGRKGEIVVRIRTRDEGAALLEVVGDGRGTGMGLAMVHAIVTAHQGRITVESEVGKGSTFRVDLPAAPPGT